MRKAVFSTFAFVFVCIVLFQPAMAQFPIKIPKLKVEKPKQDQPKPDESSTTQVPASASQQSPPKTSGANQVYGYAALPATPVLLKDTVYVQAEMSSTYWKMPNQSNYTSWVPKTRFSIFYDWNKPVKYWAEYYNPDGSLWYKEILESGNRSAERVVSFESSRDTMREMHETKASVGVGTYGFKIINKETNETVFQGKFKVNKFLRPYSERTPNRFAFFVEHDWVLPIAYVRFHFSNFIYENENVGGFPVMVSTWLKGDVKDDDLEAQLFYKGQQIANRQFGRTDGSFWAERVFEFAVVIDNPPMWKLWNFEWENFRFDNGGTFNRDNYPNAHYADKNPGEYTVKIFLKGTQIREIKFTVQPDGRIGDGFAKQIFLPYYKTIVPAKVIGNLEKWNATAWKTETFYGNPISGFTLQ